MAAAVNRANSLVHAALVDRKSLQVRGLCEGADEQGDCPRVPKGHVLPCAGSTLVTAAPSVDWYLQIEVGDCATACPLRGFRVPS